MGNTILDTAVDSTPHLPAFRAAGFRTIIRYLSPINPGGEKCIKPTEARAIAGAGLRLALVCEGWGDFAHGGISAGAGERDGAWCVRYAPSVGAPPGAVIYYAVDVDASATQIRQLVLPYFASIAKAHSGSPYKFGCYGSGAVCAAVEEAQSSSPMWLSCSLGWAGSRGYLASGRWTLRQFTPSRVAGIDCDEDVAKNGEFGDFAPFAAPLQSDPGTSIKSIAAGPAASALTDAAAPPSPPATPLLTQLIQEVGALIRRV
jgi:hypothetical protein